MKAVIQRVLEAQVEVDNKIVGKIKRGLLVFLAVHRDDSEKDTKKMADKICNLRIFQDENDKMNKSLIDEGGELLLISQFTLYGDTKKGNRPSFLESADPEKAQLFYNNLISELKGRRIKIETGIFRANMNVGLTNDGPVTIIIDI